ncbi:alpha-ketoglutarate-dependent dioxygenase alkB homolog 4 [Copidosoma floridanum]|uniref:alpha-ketoglutarate-dependent dioxygenase alkB homolog 4 n=1 Tax=Copidosoma floridanum TaxID=29053 RepID=UPI0006C9BBCF|nr:alpha-ketoglutarate-dependent dioxygenase alkB homolog 4 [Copidosoma floridanum]
METVRPCGCKGIRTCLICEKDFNILKPDFADECKKLQSYVYCPHCDKAWPGWDISLYKEHPNHQGIHVDFPGTYIQLDFLNTDECDALINSLDSLPWDTSQSGRRKQNFGPKTNFKKKRLKLGNFNGFPECTKFVQDKLSQVPKLNDFQTIEQCSLEYDPQKGASIDPHIDDCWIWGERIITVNVLGDSVLTMTPYRGSRDKYNLNCVEHYQNEDLPEMNYVVRLPMPVGSLMVLYAQARYQWEHAVLREDVNSRRVCLAYREFTPPYLPNEKTKCNEESLEILEKAVNFFH